MKYLFALVLVVSTGFSVTGQSLQRDNLFGVHVLDVQLNPGKTLEDWKEFYVREVIPVYEASWMGLRAHLLESVRGEYAGKLAIMWVFATEPTRDYYFNPDGSMHQREIDALAKVEPIEARLREEIGDFTIEYRDDWVVQ